MSALAEALLAAQRQAIAALSKAYVAKDEYGHEWVTMNLDALGCTDAIEQERLLASLDILRALGVQAPAESRTIDGPKMISDGQKPYIRDLFRKKNIEPLDDADLNALSYAKASALIESLKNGSYDPAEFTIPF